MIITAFVFTATAGLMQHSWEGWGGAEFDLPFVAAGVTYERPVGDFTLMVDGNIGTGAEASHEDLQVRIKWFDDVAVMVRYDALPVKPYLGYGFTHSVMERSFGDDDTDTDTGLRAGFEWQQWRIGYALDYKEAKTVGGHEVTHRYSISYRF